MKRGRKPKPLKPPKPTIGEAGRSARVDRNPESGIIYLRVDGNMNAWASIGMSPREATILARELLDMVIW